MSGSAIEVGTAPHLNACFQKANGVLGHGGGQVSAFGLHVESDELGFGGTELIRKLVFRIAANHHHAIHVRAIAQHVARNIEERLGLAGLGECKEDGPMALIVVECVDDLFGGSNLVRVSHDLGWDWDFWDFLNNNFLDWDLDLCSDFLDWDLDLCSDFLDWDFYNRILVLLAGFMARTVTLVISSSASPCAAAKGTLSDSTIRKLTRLTRLAGLLTRRHVDILIERLLKIDRKANCPTTILQMLSIFFQRMDF
jgi:hypothetical protein